MKSPNSATGLFDLLWSSDPTSQTAIGLVAFTFLLAVALVYAPLLLRWWRISTLSRAVRMAAGDSDRPNPVQRNEVQSAFADSLLESEWALFLQRWRAALTDGVAERSPVRFLDVLEDHPLLPSGARRALLPALPSIFLAIGLLGAFVGLGLALSSGSFSAGDGAAATNAIASQVGLSLRAALWGLGLSVVAGILGRLIDGAFEGLGADLDRSVQRCFPLVSASELTSFGQRAQHESLVALGSELTRFTNDLTERVDRGLQRIERSTASAASLVSAEQRAGVQKVVSELAMQVRAGVDAHLSELVGALERATEHQDTVTGGIAAAFNQMADQSEAHARVTRMLDAATATVEAASGSFRQTVVDFQPVLQHLRETGVSLQRTSERIETTHAIVAKAAEDVRLSLQHAASAVGDQRDFVEVSLGEIRATLDALSTGLGENLNKALRSVDDALGQTVGRLRETITESNDTIERMAGPIRSAEGTARELHSGLERVRSELTGLGDWLAQAMKPVRTTLTQLDEKTSEVSRALVSFGDRALGMDKTMDALRGDLREEGRKFRATTAELSRKLGQASEALSALEQAGSSLDPRIPRPQPIWPVSPATHVPAVSLAHPPAGATAHPTPSVLPSEPAPGSRPTLQETSATESSAGSTAPASTAGSPRMSREALRHPGAGLAPTGPDRDAAHTSPDVAPSEAASPPFKLDRAPSPQTDRRRDSQSPWSSGGTSRAGSSGGLGRSAASSFAGRKLGPDPYSRLHPDPSAGERPDRPLQADLPPDARLEEKSEELGLSGLLSGRGRGRPGAAPPPPAHEFGAEDDLVDLDEDDDHGAEY